MADLGTRDYSERTSNYSEVLAQEPTDNKKNNINNSRILDIEKPSIIMNVLLTKTAM
jgi:hypothetical protein